MAANTPTVIDLSGPASHSVDHTYNTDLSTHSLVAFHAGSYSSVSDLPLALRLSMDSARKLLLESQRAAAKSHAAAIFKKAAAKAGKEGRSSLAEIVTYAILNKDIRKGPLPPSDAISNLIDRVRAGIRSPYGLRLAVLLLPDRDRNPAKNDGVHPDLGEVSTLLRLWTIVKAISFGFKDAELKLNSVLTAAGLTSSPLIIHPTSTTAQSTTASASERTETPREAAVRYVKTAMALADERRMNRKCLRLHLMIDDLAQVVIGTEDQGDVAALLIALAQAKISIEAWMDMVASTAFPPQLVAVRDPARYSCFSTDPPNDRRAYELDLADLVDVLNLSPLLRVVCIDTLTAELSEKGREEFLARKQLLRTEIADALLAPLMEAKETILSASSRADVIAAVSAADPRGVIRPLFEAVLHGKHHPELDGLSNKAVIEFLATIYSVRAKTDAEEEIRRAVLWAGVQGAVDYAADYEANTGSKNRLGADDVAQLVPHSVRLSIHRKPAKESHFTIAVGPNASRTPWHGTAGLRPATSRRGLSLETKLSLEFKAQGYLPVMVSPPSNPSTPRSWISTPSANSQCSDNSSASACECKATCISPGPLQPFHRLAVDDQPLFWLHPSCLTSNDWDVAALIASQKVFLW